MRTLDLSDIQGNVLWGYHYAVSRLCFATVTDGVAGRAFLAALAPQVTSSVRWRDGKPASALNVAFTHAGLEALGVPARTLAGFPPEFRQGMRARAALLNDVGPNDPSQWERPWLAGDVHLMLTLHAATRDTLDARQGELHALAARHGGIAWGHVQNGGRLVVNGQLTDKEHFGYTDGYSNPEIDGTLLPDVDETRGGGKLLPDGSWAPLATGELLLGYPDEAGDIPRAPLPTGFARNGTFLVYRKLHQRVASFRRFLREEGARYAGGPDLLAAKLMGRWADGTPLMAGSGARPATDTGQVVVDPAHTDFRYERDPDGMVCPLGAHTRRANPRDATGFGTLLSERRRLMRRGIPYGPWTPADAPDDDDGEHGLLFLAMAASLERQFEFVQREWLNYGNDFHQGNDGDPIIGGSGTRGKFLIQGDPRPGPGNIPPYICRDLPLFVQLLGGDYFFIPSLSAIDQVAQGRVEPA